MHRFLDCLLFDTFSLMVFGGGGGGRVKVDTERKSSFLKCISINLSAFVCCSDTKQGRKQKRILHNILQLYAKVEDSRPENKNQRRRPSILDVVEIGSTRRKVRLIESNAKCRYLKKLTCKGTLRQVFIGLRPPPLQGFCWGGKALS